MDGLDRIYEQANFIPSWPMLNIPFYGLFEWNSIVKGVLDAFELLTWTNAINVVNPLAPVEWGLITYKQDAAAAN